MKNNLRKPVFYTLLLIILCLGYRSMISPANKSLAEQKIRVSDKLAKLVEIRKVTVTAEGQSKQLGQLQEAIRFFESKLPPKSDIHKALEQLTIIAQKQGLKPKTIRTLARKNNSGYIEQPIQMELVGDFSSFYSFLLEVEQLQRIMKIRELKLKKSMDEGNISANFVVSIFFQDESGING